MAERQPQENLLKMRDGAMDLTDPPRRALEKRHNLPPVAVDEVSPNSDVGVQSSPGGIRSAASTSTTSRIPQRGENAAVDRRPGYQVEGFNHLVAELVSLGEDMGPAPAPMDHVIHLSSGSECSSSGSVDGIPMSSDSGSSASSGSMDVVHHSSGSGSSSSGSISSDFK